MKKLLAALFLSLTVLLFGAFKGTEPAMTQPAQAAEPEKTETEILRYDRAEIIRYGGKAPDIRQVDDRDTMRRIDKLLTTVWQRESTEKTEDVQAVLAIRGDLGGGVEELTFLADGRMVFRNRCYPCTESEYQEALSLSDAPIQEKQGFWQLLDDIPEEVVDWGFCNADTTASADLLKLIERQARKETPRQAAETAERLRVDIYRGEKPESYIITPEWIKQVVDYDLYYKSTPALYERAKEIVGAQNLSFAYPKTLVIPAGQFDEKEITISDPAKIRALLEPLQGLRPIRVTDGRCGLGWIPMYLDGDKNRCLTMMGSEVSYSVTGKTYSGVKTDVNWMEILRKAANIAS